MFTSELLDLSGDVPRPVGQDRFAFRRMRPLRRLPASQRFVRYGRSFAQQAFA
jgi:hypothetical protein